MAIFASLGRQQKEAIGLLQIGSFLEYFDLRERSMNHTRQVKGYMLLISTYSS